MTAGRLFIYIFIFQRDMFIGAKFKWFTFGSFKASNIDCSGGGGGKEC